MANKKEIPAEKQEVKEMPKEEQTSVDVPESGQNVVPIPDEIKTGKSLPQVGIPENTVIIGGKLVEIKTTKLKYQRNRTAVFYHILELYPLPDILAMDKSAFGDGLDGDKKLYDWLVAVTDDEELIREHYDEIDSGTIYQLLEIFRRINKISDMEEKLKNVKTPGKG